MASSMKAAIEEVAGTCFDAVVGLTVTPPRAAPTDPAIATAIAGLGPRELPRLGRQLASRQHRHPVEADEAVGAELVELLTERGEIFLRPPEEWLGIVYEGARRRLQEAQPSGQFASVDALREDGDGWLKKALPCVPESHSPAEQIHHVPPPGPDESWSAEQILGAIQRFRDYYGRPPGSVDFRQVNGLPSLAAVRRHFGTLADALLAAGLMPSSPIRRRRGFWTPLRAARQCRAFRRHHARWPNSGDIKRYPGELPSTTVMTRYFGGTRAIDVQLGAEAILEAVGEPTA